MMHRDFMGYNRLITNDIYEKFHIEVKKTIKIGGDGSYLIEN